VIEGINLIPAPGVEAQVEVARRGTPINGVQVREARRSRMLSKLRDAEWRQDSLIEAHTRGVVRRAEVDVVPSRSAQEVCMSLAMTDATSIITPPTANTAPITRVNLTC
jgi:hypothetical protein